MNFKKLILAFIALMLPLLANAEHGAHPHYLHALSDLRTARWLLENRPADGEANAHKAVAVREITAAIDEIKRAAIDDGRDIHDHAEMDVSPGRGGNFHQALELLQNLRSDLANEEDDRISHRLHYRVGRHIDAAINATERAIRDIERHR